MGIAYKIDSEIGAMFTVYDGVVTDEEYLAHTDRLLADPAWPPKHKLDLTDLTTLAAPFSDTAIRQGGERWAPHKDQIKGMRIAGVAREGFDMAVLFENTITEHGPTMIVFYILETACLWLGIDQARASETLGSLRSELRQGH